MKPIEILTHEFNKNLIELINNSGLPPVFIVQALRLVLVEVEAAAESMYKQAMEIYNKETEGGDSE
ncbi:MAG: hypothetical protein Q4D81_00540 [Eubacteriales bacterium]|nr:hypothetical protein [Eubacteriales bacterium]